MDEKNQKNEYDPAESAFRVRQMILERKAKERAEEEEEIIQYRQSHDLSGYYEPKEPQYDSVNTLENDEATVLYIAVMIIGTLFYDRIIIWIAATIVFVLFMTRHSRKGGR